MFYVYELRDETGTTFYVGKGSGRRMYQHKYKAKAGEDTPRAQRIRDILARGGGIAPVIVFRTADESEAYTQERRFITMHGRANLTNQTDGGCGIRNVTPAVRAKMAAARLGKKASEVTRQRQREAKLGTHHSKKTKAKIAAYQRGSKHPWASLPRSEETRRKLATWTGRKHSAATIKKMSKAKRGHIVSVETRLKISVSKKGTIPWNKPI
jgi:hypothetical protein